MQQQGIVKRIDGDMAKVAFAKKGGCGGGCSSCKSGCPKDTIIVDIKNTKDASTGDTVLVDMDSKTFSNMAFWAYAFPTFITIIALCLSLYLFNKFSVKNYEVYACLIAFVTMFISYNIGSKLNKHKNKYEFNMIKRLNNSQR